MTAKQEQLLGTYLSSLDETIRPVYAELAEHLLGLGYFPTKNNSNISFQCKSHGKQLAKMGFRNNRLRPAFFALRFSGCETYPERFAKIADDEIARYPNRAAQCVNGNCGYCGGHPLSHVYKSSLEGFETRYNCGAYALGIPDVSGEDIADIKKLIDEEHAYLMKYQAGGNQNEV